MGRNLLVLLMVMVMTFLGNVYADTIETGFTYISENTDNLDECLGYRFSSIDKIAQGFKVGTTRDNYSGVRFYIDKVDNPGDIEVRIETNEGGEYGNPSGTLADTNATAILAEVDVTGPGWYTVYFANSVSLNADTQYHLVLQLNDNAPFFNGYYISYGSMSETEYNYGQYNTCVWLFKFYMNKQFLTTCQSN